MNALLVHADNLNPDLVKNFPGNKEAFDYSQSIQNANFVLDNFLHERLLDSLKNKEYNVIFIPYTLSQQNYLELTGLRVAAHIRVTKDFNHQFVPIVFIGSETPEQIAKLSELGNILFTPGIFKTQKYDVNSYVTQYEWIVKNKPKITETELNKCFERLKIAPPANYQSHHSIDNELALLRWSEYIGCSEKISEVKENIKTSLYFKYHQALNPCPLIQDRKNFLLSGVGNILLIDDEAEKGWKDFYEDFFQNNIKNNTIKFDYLNIDFKSNSKPSEIVEKAKEKVTEFKPKVVLLDLRLCDQDFSENVNPEKLTGIQILKEIKEINKGIQVIVTTASNKSWNYQTALSFGADGYIVKQGNSDVKEDISNLKELIEKSLKEASYQIKIWDCISEALKIWNKYPVPKRKNIIEPIHDKLWNNALHLNVKDFLNNSFDTLANKKINERFTLSILTLYRIIEMINEFYIYSTGSYKEKNILLFFDQDNTPVPKISYNNHNYSIDANHKGTLSTLEKIYAIHHRFFRKIDNDLYKKLYSISNYRNSVAIHPEKRFKEETLEYLFENNFTDFEQKIIEFYEGVTELIKIFK